MWLESDTGVIINIDKIQRFYIVAPTSYNNRRLHCVQCSLDSDGGFSWETDTDCNYSILHRGSKESCQNYIDKLKTRLKFFIL